MVMEWGNGGVEDVLAATHDDNGGAVLAQLEGYLKADPRSSAGEQGHLPLEHVGLERRLHC